MKYPEAPGNLIYDWEIGDSAATDAAIASAAHVTEMKIVNNRLAPNPMEPRACLMAAAACPRTDPRA